MPRFELYNTPEPRRAKPRGGGAGARAFALLLALWAIILLWASSAIFGL
jgi:hypothetical protein